MRFGSLIAAVLVSIAGCGEEQDASPSFEDRIPLGLELKAADRTVVWGERAKLSGKLTQGDDLLEGEEVVLEADAYPFDGNFAEVDTVTTGRRGEFSFKAEPDANTEYRAAAGELSETTSDPVRIFVEPQIELEVEPAGNGTRYTTVFRHPKERSLQGSTVFSYAASVAEVDASGALRFIRTTRVEQDRQGLSSASIRLPFAEGEIRYATCESYTPSAGMSGARDSCPQTRIPAG